MDLEAAAAVLGVHYQTAYRWVRAGILPAARLASGYELDRGIVEALAREQQPCRPKGPSVDPDWQQARHELLGHLSAGDDIAARRLCDRLRGTGIPSKMLWARVIVPAIQGLEAGIMAGSVHPGEVSRAMDTCERVVGLLASPPRGRPRGLALVASPEGERRRLPSLVTTAVLRADRWRVHHLGSHVPARDLVEFIEETLPDLVALSVPDASPGMAEFCRTVSSVVGVPIVTHVYAAPLRDLFERLDDVTSKRARGAEIGLGTASTDSA